MASAIAFPSAVMLMAAAISPAAMVGRVAVCAPRSSSLAAGGLSWLGGWAAGLSPDPGRLVACRSSVLRSSPPADQSWRHELRRPATVRKSALRGAVSGLAGPQRQRRGGAAPPARCQCAAATR